MYFGDFSEVGGGGGSRPPVPASASVHAIQPVVIVYSMHKTDWEKGVYCKYRKNRRGDVFAQISEN